MDLPPKSTAAKARRVSVLGTLTDYSDIPNSQDLPSQLQRFKPWLAQLHGDFSSPSCHTAPGLSLDSGPNIACVAPSGSVPHPGEREQKQQPIGTHPLTQAGAGKAATAGLCAESLGYAHSGASSSQCHGGCSRHLHATQHWCLNSQLPHSHLLQCIHIANSGPLPISNL